MCAKEKINFGLAEAEHTAELVVEALRDVSREISIAGSIRRHRDKVRDIDIVIVPDGVMVWDIDNAMIKKIHSKPPSMKGQKIRRYMVPLGDLGMEIEVDLYIANPDIYAGLLLVRTGSAAHNVKLAHMAKDNGLKFKANGAGIWDRDEKNRLGWRTEKEIFEALGLPFIEPKDREAPEWQHMVPEQN